MVAGARPNFMKVAPVLAAFRAAGDDPLLVHTGQHYDDDMAGTFFAELGIQAPDFHLGVGSGSHAQQTARVMSAFEPVLVETCPEWVVVVGDVNSTLAAALVTAKLREQLGCGLAHVEAGLRSGDWRMPEEINRVLTDKVSDLLLTPSRDAHTNLVAEGVSPGRIHFVGNVMIDTLVRQRNVARDADVPSRLGLRRRNYALVTLHRPSNVDDPTAFRTVIEALVEVAKMLPVLFPMHPRTRARVEQFRMEQLLESIQVMEPLGYTEMLSLTDGAAVVLTDSGGLQEETTVLGVPCVTLREHTERPITITEGTNCLAAWPLNATDIMARVSNALSRPSAVNGPPEGWDGRASERIVAAMHSFQRL